MSGISIKSNFDLGASLPIDSRLVIDTLANLYNKNYNKNNSYIGMIVYVTAECKYYKLLNYNGTSDNPTSANQNTCWQELTALADSLDNYLSLSGGKMKTGSQIIFDKDGNDSLLIDSTSVTLNDIHAINDRIYVQNRLVIVDDISSYTNNWYVSYEGEAHFKIIEVEDCIQGIIEQAFSDEDNNQFISSYASNLTLSNNNIIGLLSPDDSTLSTITLKNGTPSIPGLTKLYTSTGMGNDGTMTRSSITNALNEKASLLDPTFTGIPKAPTADIGTNTTQIATTEFVQTAVSNGIAASDAMIFKGTIGVNGNVTTLPTTYKTGWTYRVITAGMYAGQICEIGDLIIALEDRDNSGNLDSDWTVAQTNIDGAITSIISGTAMVVSNDGNSRTIAHADVTTGSIAKGDEDKTLTWNSTFTIPTITYNDQGHVISHDKTVMTMPDNPNTNYTTRLIVGNSNVSYTNSAATNGEVWLNLYDNKIPRQSINIIGINDTQVTSDATGKITITSDNNKVKQMNSTANADYRILLSASNDDLLGVDMTYKSNKFIANPSTGVFTAVALKGNLSTDYLTQGNDEVIFDCGNAI